MATKHKRTTMTARQLAEDYLAHQITRDVTRTSTRHQPQPAAGLVWGLAGPPGGRGLEQWEEGEGTPFSVIKPR